jgi:hypothetical protein
MSLGGLSTTASLLTLCSTMMRQMGTQSSLRCVRVTQPLPLSAPNVRKYKELPMIPAPYQRMQNGSLHQQPSMMLSLLH